MSTITKEWLRSQISAIKSVGITESNTLQAFEIALASLEAEAVALRDERSGSGGISKKPGFNDLPHGTPLYTAPPTPVSVPDDVMAAIQKVARIRLDLNDFDGDKRGILDCLSDAEEALIEVVNRRAAMLQGADTELQRKAAIHDALCQKYNVESLADFVNWQRNHIAELEAAPPAPVGEGETAVMPDYPGYTMTQRECFQAGKKAGLAEAVTTACKLPASTPCKDAPEHIWLQTAGVWPENGEFSELTWCSDNQHQDDTLYVRADVVPGSSPVIPDGCALVPVEPTLEMIKAGANAASTGMLIPGMYRAMITAAPQQEVKNG